MFTICHILHVTYGHMAPYQLLASGSEITMNFPVAE